MIFSVVMFIKMIIFQTLIKEKMLSEFMPKLYNYLTMRLKENNEGQGFFVGNKVIIGFLRWKLGD